ncbi:unnamed protein product [Ceratitis capitata]|uniref:(Mediterranean fruit fly) hypothetical protein n=1 Tax=Ceratitis capitata TaxID=7213 RepID=A0A811UE95_CERCA|nr:unnamed protein product [Ceratitis capitata]
MINLFVWKTEIHLIKKCVSRHDLSGHSPKLRYSAREEVQKKFDEVYSNTLREMQRKLYYLTSKYILSKLWKLEESCKSGKDQWVNNTPEVALLKAAIPKPYYPKQKKNSFYCEVLMLGQHSKSRPKKLSRERGVGEYLTLWNEVV